MGMEGAFTMKEASGLLSEASGAISNGQCVGVLPEEQACAKPCVRSLDAI